MAKKEEGGGNKLPLIIVVNGDPTPVEGNLHAPLHTVVQKALSDTQNTGRKLEDWELRDEDGNELDLSRKLLEFGFPPNTVLSLTLKAGVLG